jgi:hypothetical protein
MEQPQQDLVPSEKNDKMKRRASKSSIIETTEVSERESMMKEMDRSSKRRSLAPDSESSSSSSVSAVAIASTTMRPDLEECKQEEGIVKEGAEVLSVHKSREVLVDDIQKGGGNVSSRDESLAVSDDVKFGDSIRRDKIRGKRIGDRVHGRAGGFVKGEEDAFTAELEDFCIESEFESDQDLESIGSTSFSIESFEGSEVHQTRRQSVHIETSLESLPGHVDSVKSSSPPIPSVVAQEVTSATSMMHESTRAATSPGHSLPISSDVDSDVVCTSCKISVVLEKSTSAVTPLTPPLPTNTSQDSDFACQPSVSASFMDEIIDLTNDELLQLQTNDNEVSPDTEMSSVAGKSNESDVEDAMSFSSEDFGEARAEDPALQRIPEMYRILELYKDTGSSGLGMYLL